MMTPTPRILVVGGGAVGSLLSARLTEMGANITLLTRQERHEQITLYGLQLTSSYGRFRKIISTTTAVPVGETFDLVVLACRAHRLTDALQVAAPAIERDTVVLTLVDGGPYGSAIRHQWPDGCLVEGMFEGRVTIDADGVIAHYGAEARLTVGTGRATQPAPSEWLALFKARGIAPHIVDNIAELAWARTVFLAAGAAVSIMTDLPWRDAIRTSPGARWAQLYLENGARRAEYCGVPISERALKRYWTACSSDGDPVLPPAQVIAPRGAGAEAMHILTAMARRRNRGVQSTIFDMALDKAAEARECSEAY